MEQPALPESNLTESERFHQERSFNRLRLVWGAERVYLAWIRTAIALMAIGFLIARLGWILPAVMGRDADARFSPWEASVLGTLLIGLGAGVSVAATWRYHQTRVGIYRGKAVNYSSRLTVAVGLLTGAIGAGLIAFLLVTLSS